jgi:ankyrin repeat protein
VRREAVVHDSELSDAISRGDLEAVQSLLDDGADVRYVRPKGYAALIDAVYAQQMLDDERLVSLLRLLIERGADLDAVSDHGESALSVASRFGRFGAVGVLLDGGADPGPLRWTPLLLVVALGSVSDVRSTVREGVDLAARDSQDRTAWLLGIQTGDVAKAEVLLAAGADRSDRGRGGKTPLQYAVDGGHGAMLEWLLALGTDPDEADDFGDTALVLASEMGAADCVESLLAAGADAHQRGHTSSPIDAAETVEVARLLVAAGADINDVNAGVRAALARRPHDGSISCTPEDYRAAKYRVFGRTNPEQMNFPFWRAMVIGGACAYRARERFEPGGITDGAVWCYDRFGSSLTELPDGRVVEIGGEHEDFYDPDFCIYNDVVVHRADGTFDIYGYPEDVFPPTDFHSATLVGDHIYIISSLGYHGSRSFGTTPVYRLDVDTLAIEPVATTGETPGWIRGHKARLVGNRIELRGGQICGLARREETDEANADTFVLDLGTKIWSRTN